MKPTIKDIADRVGVSTATVSRALTGKSYVKVDLADRIRAAAHSMNYTFPDTHKTRKALLVASQSAMIDLERSQFTLHVIEGLKERATSLGIEIESCPFTSSAELRSVAERAQAEELLGLILLTVEDDILPLIRDMACPVVLVNSDDPEMKLSSVTPCNRSAAALAVRHLMSLGHRKILFLTKSGRRTVQRRLEGLRDALGDDFDPALVVDCRDWTAEASRAAVDRAIQSGLKFTAVLAAGDILAAGALLALQARGYSIPRDVSVVGIDGLPQGAYLSPALTSVAIPMHSIGAQSVDLLNNISRLHGAASGLPAMRVELACELLERETCADAPVRRAHPDVNS